MEALVLWSTASTASPKGGGNGTQLSLTCFTTPSSYRNTSPENGVRGTDLGSSGPKGSCHCWPPGVRRRAAALPGGKLVPLPPPASPLFPRNHSRNVGLRCPWPWLAMPQASSEKLLSRSKETWQVTWEAGLGGGRHHELSWVCLGCRIAFWGSGFFP